MFERFPFSFAGFSRLPAAVLLALIRGYQWLISPALRVIAGPTCGCRFSPTCSHYAAEAVATHGALTGTWLAAVRLLKCTPLHPGGFDPVPAPRVRTCSRVHAPQTFPPFSAAGSRAGGPPVV